MEGKLQTKKQWSPRRGGHLSGLQKCEKRVMIVLSQKPNECGGEGGSAMGVHDGHRKRVKEEFLKNDLDHLPPHRVLELLLFFSIPQGDTNELAHALMDRFGSFSAVLEAPYEELLKIPGVGQHTACHISLLRSVARRYCTEKAEMQPAQDPLDAIGKQMVARYIGYTEERLTLVCLDNSLRVLYFDMVKAGVADMVQLQFRDLAKIALGCNATNIILGHNHPNGVALPSRADKETTIALFHRFRELDIDLLDHFIVAGGDYLSMAESGIFSAAFLTQPVP